MQVRGDLPGAAGLGRLAGRVAIVTGGGKGIGQSIATEFAREGARVVIVANRDLASAEMAVAAIHGDGGAALARLCDITDRAAVDALVAEVEDRHGRVDILVNNAGQSAPGPLENLAEADWDRVFTVNTKGTFLLGTAVARGMIRRGAGGTILNIAGASAHRCYPGAGGYGPAKAAVVNLTVQMSLEWSRHGIRVNGISPGPIREPGSGWEAREPALADEVRRIPLKRAGAPRDVACAAVFLASEDAGYITGQMLIVDGGGVGTWYLSG